MATPWVLVGWAQQFRTELNALAPRRDKASDGSIGDTAHRLSVSGHNQDDTPGVRAEYNDRDGVPEVRAIDVDKDLNVPRLTAQMIVAYLVGRCRAGLEKRFAYVIFNRTIWSASSGWQARKYTGSNPHDKHFHLSGVPAGDNDRRPFGLASLTEEDDLKADERKWLETLYNQLGNPAGGFAIAPDKTKEPLGVLLRHLAWPLINNPGETGSATYIAAWMRQQAAETAALHAVVTDLAATIKAGGGSVDTAAILAGVNQAVTAAVNTLTAETRDAVADLGEGGAAQVRATT